eukprot:m.51944 g.51944  ORF g.51944 m.51944 type:complete len:140 (+) comp21523_c1_seq1:426-845(+)
MSAPSKEDVDACFDLFDAGGSGSLEGKSVIGKAYRALGYAPSEEELAELLGGSDSIDLETFKKLSSDLGTPQVEEVLEAFSVFDQNGNGYISLKELSHLMGSLGEGLSKEHLEAMAATSEPDDEGQVNIRHFVSKLLAA